MKKHTALTLRQQRGLILAATAKIMRDGNGWIVQSGKKRYKVCLDSGTPYCSCRDHEATGQKCKHIFAVECVLADSCCVPPFETGNPNRKPSYSQDWAAYNKAQTSEKKRFVDLLHDLCYSSIEFESSTKKKGRPHLPIPDLAFGACLRVYGTLSGRRSDTDVKTAHKDGYISTAPHFNSIRNFLGASESTAILRNLITESSLPLTALEDGVFAVDASGFSNSRFSRWCDDQHERGGQRQEWVKVHVACGVRTKVVPAVEIREKDANDTRFLPGLVDATAENFELSEVLADKGYVSARNLKAIAKYGATPYIPFKNSHTGRTPGLWRKLYHFYHMHREEFLEHYHKRSIVESTFSMIKRKFGDYVRGRTDVAMANEVLCKIICHNICCLIRETETRGIDTVFWEPPN